MGSHHYWLGDIVLWWRCSGRHSLSVVSVVLGCQPIKVGRRPGTVTPKSSPGSFIVMVIVTVSTGYNMLLGQVVIHLTTLLPETGFYCGNCSKGSAATTLALVLYRGDSTLGLPIPGRGHLLLILPFPISQQ